MPGTSAPSSCGICDRSPSAFGVPPHGPRLRFVISGACILLLALLIGTLHLAARSILMNGFAQIERQETVRNIRRASAGLDRATTGLGTKASDWAAWDDAYSFIDDRNQSFIDSNLTPASLANLDVHAILFFDARAGFVVGAAIDDDGNPREVSPVLLDALARSPAPHHDSTTSRHEGILILPEEIILLASRPILTSDNAGPVRGAVVFVRRLDAEFLARLAEQTQLEIEVFRADSPSLTADCRDALPTARRDGQHVTALNYARVAGYALVPDLTASDAVLVRIRTTRDVHHQGVLTMRWLLASIVIVALAITGALLLLLDRLVISRLERMSRMVQRIGAGGDAPPLPERGVAELGVLAGSINRMVAALTCASDRLASHAAELKVKSEQLEQSRLAAEAANLAKTEFLANMSHEIRTPMTAVLGYADLCMEQGVSEEERDHHLAMIATAGNSLLTVINNVLDISKIEAGHLAVERVSMNPGTVVADVAALLRAGASSKNVSLVVACDSPIPETIHSDPVRFRQILTNVIGNAVKFTASGEVRVGVRVRRSVEPARDSLIVEVRDTGIGITPREIDRLFQPFSQADSSTMRRFGGSGLGLCISKRLTEALGGSIGVSSSPGKGTVFTITIDAGSLDDAHWTDQLAPSVTPRSPRAGSVPATAPALHARILLADDSSDNQRLLAHILRRAGARVDVVGDGALAVDAARAAAAGPDPFRLILLDMHMPNMDGYTAARRLRDAGIDAPIIALTAYALSDAREKCMAAGCNDYAAKPIARAELLRVCAQWLDQSRNQTSAAAA